MGVMLSLGFTKIRIGNSSQGSSGNRSKCRSGSSTVSGRESTRLLAHLGVIRWIKKRQDRLHLAVHVALLMLAHLKSPWRRHGLL